MINYARYAKIALGLWLASASSAHAQQISASATATASVTLLQPITLEKVLDMKFGSVMRPTNANTNTVTVSAAGARTISGSGNGGLVGTVSQQAQFKVSGEGASNISVTVPATFTMGPFTVTTSGIYPTVIGGAYGSQGTAMVNVGGAYTMSSAATPGTYTGTLTVTVSYN